MSESYQRFPLIMTHPHFQPARLGTSDDARKGTKGLVGTPIRFPPVTVHDEKMEEYHTAQGYQPAGKIDPMAFVSARTLTSDEGPFEFREYPKMVGTRIVNSEAEEAQTRADLAREEVEAARQAQEEADRAAREAVAEPGDADGLRSEVRELRGLVEMLLEKLTAPAASPSSNDVPMDARASLARRAEELGLRVDGRWSIDRIQAEIATAESKAA